MLTLLMLILKFLYCTMCIEQVTNMMTESLLGPSAIGGFFSKELRLFGKFSVEGRCSVGSAKMVFRKQQ